VAVTTTEYLTPSQRCAADARRLPWARLRRTAVMALDGALVIGTGAAAGLLGGGAAVASPPPTPGWSGIVAPPATAFASGDAPESVDTDLNSESCTSAVFCVAAGYYEGESSFHPLLDTYSGGSWSAVEAPLPSDHNASDYGYFESVSCPTNGFCVAVGGYENSGGHDFGLIDTLSGGHWTAAAAQPAPNVVGLMSSSFKSVSCANDTSCLTGGNYDATGGEYGYLDTFAGGQWTPSTAAQPSGAATQQSVRINDVSCPADGSACVADGLYDSASSHDIATLLSDAGGSWSAVDAPLPSNQGGTDSNVSAISCAAGACEVVGTYSLSGSQQGALLEREVNGQWTATQAPEPSTNAGSGPDQAGNLEAVSCAGDGSCAAVGNYTDTSGGQRGMIETITAGVPAVQETPQPSDAAPETNQATYLNGVSCLSAATCAAVGTYQNSASGTSSIAFVVNESGGTWSAQPAALPSDPATGSNAGSVLDGVVCTWGGGCDGYGFYANAGGMEAGLLESFTPSPGYWEVAGDGGIFSLGAAPFHGSQGAQKLNQPVVGMAATPGDSGYWLVASDGGIFTHGNAQFYGSMGGQKLNKPIVGMAATPDGRGYWLVASDGGIFTFGDAAFYGSLGGQKLNAPIVGMAATPDGGGYWLVASDGGVFTKGDAQYYGSMGGQRLNKPIVGMAANVTGAGYWLVASDGGVFSFGDAVFHGSTGAIHLNKPIVGLLATFDGGGYWELASDGGIFSQGDAQFSGSEGNIHLNSPVVNGAAS
jgi:hypothetical protein